MSIHVPLRRSLAGISAGALVLGAAVSGLQPAQADAPATGLVADYSFTTKPADGRTVDNLAAGSTLGAAVVQNPADTQWADQALTFTGGAKTSTGNWVRLPDGILAGKTSATVTVEVKADAAILKAYHYLWNVGAEADTTRYFFATMGNAAKPRSAITTNSNGAEKNAASTTTVVADRWYSITTVLDGQAQVIKTYIDGVLAGQAATGGLTPASITNHTMNTIGRAPWPDSLFKGAVSRFRVYDVALTDAQVADVSTTDAAIHTDAIKAIAENTLSTIQPITADTAVVTLPTQNGAVNWASSDPRIVVSADGTTATVQQPAAGQAAIASTLTATATVRGQSASRQVDITIVPEAAAEDEFGYLMVHFLEDSAGYAEKIYLDVSNGNNPMSWTRLGGGNPILASDLGTTGVRDPFLVRNPVTGKYYIMATDLRVWMIPGTDCPYGVPTGYCPWYGYDHHSQSLVVWESDDLVNWGEPRLLDVAPPTAGMAWAPEATWVAEKNAFIVYWSSNVFAASDPDHTGTSTSDTLYGFTSDFTQADWDTKNPGGTGTMYRSPGTTSTIDTSIHQFTDAAGEVVTYRAMKENGGRSIVFQKTTGANWWDIAQQGAWTDLSSGIGKADYGDVEAPLFFQENGKDHWFLYVDQYGSGGQGYRPYETADISAGQWTRVDQTKLQGMVSNTKHGGVLPLTKAEYDRVRAGDVTSLTTARLSTSIGTPVTLPKTVAAKGSDGVTREIAVTWDTIPAGAFDKAGDIVVRGTLAPVYRNQLDAVKKENGEYVLYASRPLTATAVISVAGAALNAAADALFVPAVLVEGSQLPTASNGATVTWKSSDATVVGMTGVVAAPAAGFSAPVTLTATIALNGQSTTKTFTVKVIEAGATPLTGYTLAPVGIMNSSVHLALLPTGEAAHVLHFGQGIIFARADWSNTVPDPERGVSKGLVDPYLFRMADGGFGIVATRTQSTGAEDPAATTKVLLFTTKDLFTWTEVGLVDIGAAGTVAKPAAEMDAATGSYRVWWTDGDGVSHRVDTTDFVTFSKPVDANRDAELNAAVLGGTSYTTPDSGVASSVERNAVALTDAEVAVLRNHYDQVTNTTVDAKSLTLDQGAAAVTAESLGKVVANYSDGSTAEKRVAWNADELAAVDTTKPGTYTVNGTVQVTDLPFPLITTATADPQVFLYKDSYYFIATNEAGGQKYLDIRKSDTILGLRTATPVRILTENVLTWAPEVHEINGQLFLFYARSAGSWTTVQMVVRALNVGADPADPAAWGPYHPVVGTDGEPVRADGEAITLDETYFQVGDTHYVVWSDASRINPTASTGLAIATIDPAQPWQLTSEPRLITRPDFGWDRQTTFVDEGPFALFHDGKVILTFSGSGVDNTYAVGTVSAEVDSDLLDPASWTRSNEAILTSSNIPGQMGPGHNAFFYSKEGDLMVSVHAKVNGGSRVSGVRLVQWRADGTPILDLTAAREVLPENRTVVATITVKAMVEPTPSVSPSPEVSTSPSVSPSPEVSVSPSVSPSATASASPTAPASPTPSVTRTSTAPTPSATQTVILVPKGGDLYTMPGFHYINGRQWYTTCEPYSQTIRCRTDIWTTRVVFTGGKFVSQTGWAFNNWTYLPMMTRQQWGTNPLARTGEWTSNGYKWRTECDTVATGANACRSYVWTTFVKPVVTSTGTSYTLAQGWVVNNIVRFKA